MIKKALKRLGIILGMTLLALIGASMITFHLPVEETQELELKAKGGCNTLEVILEKKMAEGVWRPIISGSDIQVYCIQPGSPVPVRCQTCGKNYHTSGDIYGWVDQKKHLDHAKLHTELLEHIECSSTTYYKCEGNHYTESSSSIHGRSVGNLYDVAYIVSYYPQPGMDSATGSTTEWSSTKQIAVWMSPLSKKGLPSRNFSSGDINMAKAIREQSINYKTFFEKIMAGTKGMKAENKTDDSQVKWNTNQETKIHTIGPFKLNYVDGSFEDGGYSFGGISDMYLIDNNGKRIDITNFVFPNRPPQASCIVDGQPKPYLSDSCKPDFFTNYDDGYRIYNPNCVDFWDWKRVYPNPNEEFYIEFPFLDDDTMGSLKIHVDFQYLECTAEVCVREGHYYVLKELHKDENLHCHGHEEEDSDGDIDIEYCEGCCQVCDRKAYVSEEDSQDGGVVIDYKRELIHEELEIKVNDKYLPSRMKIGGFVFEDIPQGKENLADGKKAENDINLKNIQVTLYEVETNALAKLTTYAQEDPDNAGQEDDFTRRINSTLTDEYGYYEFRGVSREKKFYIQFTYNGQTYTATDYLKDMGAANVEGAVQAGNYDAGETRSKDWQVTSKGTELNDERTEFDESFGSIGSSPENYVSSNSLGKLSRMDGRYYNKTYTENDLVGFKLNSQGDYVQSGEQLVDTYLKLQGGKIIDTANTGNPELREGRISKEIRRYIEQNKAYPTDLNSQIYSKIAGGNKEIWKKLQFIEDCKINSYTKSQASNTRGEYDVYPVFNQFTTFVASGNLYPENSYDGTTYNDSVSTYANTIMKATASSQISQYRIHHNVFGNSGYIYQDYAISLTNVEYKNVYAGQLLINQGLWRRPVADMALRKDVYKAVLEINGKTQVYKYDERDVITSAEKAELERLEARYGRNSDQYLDYKTQLENKFWDIQERILDYATYYDSLRNYNRELYESDFYYNGQNKLEAYVTYKITIRNESQSIMTQIDEIVDYYDNTYEPIWDKSWVMYKDDVRDDNEDIRVRDQEYYDIMVGDRKVAQGKYRAVTSRRNGYNSQYGSQAQFSSEFRGQNYETIYVDGLKDKRLDPGEQAYVYLTFKVKGDGRNLSLKEATTDPGKQNIAEINGYTTYYIDGFKMPNDIQARNDSIYMGGRRIRGNKIAGKLDVDSNPGNFTVDDLLNRAGNNRYEQNFEDDADRARGIRIFVEAGPLERIVSGVAWEDKRTKLVEDSLIGDGIRQDGTSGEVRINDILVELLEVDLVYNSSTNKWEPRVDKNGDIVTKQTEFKSENGDYYVAGIYDKDGNFKPATMKTQNLDGEEGKYLFKGLVPGDYIVRFTYGGNYNAHYNGQDYKTTTYQLGITGTDKIKEGQRTDVAKLTDPGYTAYTNYGAYDNQGANYGQNASGSYGYDIYLTDNNEQGNVSDAKDLWRLRAQVNNYSSNQYRGVTNGLAETLANNDQPNKNTQMIAETGVIRAEFEYNRQNSEQNSIVSSNGRRNTPQSNNNYGGTQTGEWSYTGQNNGNNNDQNGIYHIKNVDLGLEERPKAGLELNKRVSNIKLTLANGNILFDTDKTVTDLQWIHRQAYQIDQYKDETKFDTVGPKADSNGKKNVYSDYTKYKDFRNYVLDRVAEYVTGSSTQGVVYINMDDELMHGANIQITYDMTVTNTGEVDYRETKFYYTGTVQSTKNIVTTSADLVQDYVANNLQFRTQSNNPDWGWKTITNEKIKAEGYVNNEVEKELKDYNMTIQTTALGKELIPVTKDRGSNLKEPKTPINEKTQDQTTLILTQLINPQNTKDDLYYRNIAEIVKISNSVGRRMAFSVQGNQVPSKAPTEQDASYAESISITPPTGGQYIVYISVITLVVVLLTAGIFIIKKIVLK